MEKSGPKVGLPHTIEKKHHKHQIVDKAQEGLKKPSPCRCIFTNFEGVLQKPSLVCEKPKTHFMTKHDCFGKIPMKCACCATNISSMGAQLSVNFVCLI